ncbi:AAA family ATPase [Bacillus sp. EB106-08-02-XG196]|uniref:AAA family ATPase n=1 Tax=Bacillus sp. EB106-08-02-XG196 TaxID=2737049 RepID=UPI0015C43CAB|nr:AAA family ATPase [Bacillus sp. EB106-08-02-XG196]NWQ43311.1 AAA family ATPase [Bacillus sp. EB106-08-02-XG196]
MSKGFLIKEIYIKNFRGYEEKTFTFFNGNKDNSGLILLSGSNGYGKTSLLDAFEWCFTGTIHRLKEDYDARNEKRNLKVKKGLIRHNGQNGDVVVKIEFIYKGADYKVKRIFNSTDESLAFDTENSDFYINDEEITQLKTIDYVLDEPIAKDFYERYTCSYEKNLRIYEKSRENIYHLFSSFFGGTKDIEKIINNLDGDKKDKKHKGIIEQVETKVKAELIIDFEKKKEKYDEAFKELNDLLQAEQNNVSNDIKPQIYPIQKYYEDEIKPISIIESDENFEEKVIKLKRQKTYIQNIKILQEKHSGFKVANQLKTYLDKLNRYDEFISRIYQPYQVNKVDIKSIQGKDSNDIVEEKQAYLLHQRELSNVSKPSIDGIKILKDISSKIKGIDTERFQKFQSIDIRLKEYHTLDSQLKGFNTADEQLKSLRVLVDNKVGFESHRNEGNKKCPLCGSNEKFSDKDVELSRVAKDILGEIDNKRNELQLTVDRYQQSLHSIYQTFFDYIKDFIGTNINNLDNLLKSFNVTNEFKNNCIHLKLDFQKINEEIVEEKKRLLENELIKTDEFIAFEETFLSNLINEDQELFGMLDKNNKVLKKIDYKALDISRKINYIHMFINSYQKLKEGYPIIIPIEEINHVDIISKISYLDLWILRIETDKNLRSKRNQLQILESSYKASEKEYLQKMGELKKLKQILTKMKNIRNQWDKKMVEDIKVPLQKIYRRINRHTNIQDINLLIDGKTNQMASLNANINDEEISATNILSAGQLSVMALAIFITVSMGQKENLFKCFFLDDPIQTMDDLNILSFVDLLRTELSESNKNNRFIDQLFFTTCDENLERLITHKMKSFGVNYTHIHFTGYGDAKVLA